MINKPTLSVCSKLTIAFCVVLLCVADVQAQDASKSTALNADEEQAQKTERTLFEQASLLVKQNKNKDAEEILERLAKNNNVSVLTNYGIVLIKLGKINSAIQVLSKARDIAPSYYPALFYLCQAYKSAGELDKAITATEDYQKTLAQTKPQAAAKIDLELNKLRTERDWQRSIAVKSELDYLEEASSPAIWTADSMPVKIYVAENRDKEQLCEAFRDWAKATDKKIKIEFTPNADEAKILCSWTNDASSLSSPLEGGETLVSKSQDGKMLSAKVQILQSEDPAERRAAALHEAGHSLGLGHSSRPGDAMFFAFNRDAFTGELSKRDKRTAKRLYESDLEELARIRNQSRQESAESNSPIQKAIDLNRQASEFFAGGNFAQATSLLQQADALAPNTQTIEENLAAAYLRLADQECIDQSFTEAEKHLNLAATYFAKVKKFDKAKSVYRDLANLSKTLKKPLEEKSYLEKELELNALISPMNSQSASPNGSSN